MEKDCKFISVSQLKEITEKELNINLLDVRTAPEYQSEHVKGARNFPLDQIESNKSSIPFKKDEEIYILCKSGARATKASRSLSHLGFQNTHVVEGGTDQCIQDGIETIKSKSNVISLERQVRIVAGIIVALGSVLAMTIHHYFAVIPLFVGSGLTFAGITNTCGMGLLLAKAPWNK